MATIIAMTIQMKFSDCTCETRRHLVTCPRSTEFTDCIPTEWVCDGHPDCPGGAEEIHCPTYNDTLGELLMVFLILV